MQLPDPQARSFTPAVLQKAMLETIAHINRLLDEHDVTEVCAPHITFERLTDILQAQFDELLCHRWRNRCRHSLYYFAN